MKVQQFRLCDLKTISVDTWKAKLNKIPLSSRRLASQTKNPFADKEDVLLITAEENDILLGFVGIMPEVIKVDKKPEKFYWNTCWWVDPNHKNLSVLLFREMLKTTKGKMFFFDLSPESYAFLSRFPGFETKIIPGFHYVSIAKLSSILSRKFPKANHYPLNKIINAPGQIIQYILAQTKKQDPTTIQYREINKISKEMKVFLDTTNQNNLTQRSLPFFQWVIDKPWVGNEAIDQLETDMYPFSVYSKRHAHKMIEFRYKESICGFCFLTLGESNKRISSWRVAPKMQKQTTRALFHYLAQKDIEWISTFNLDIIKNAPSFSRVKIKTKRLMAWPTHLKQYSFNDCKIQDGDGDLIFV